MADDRSQHGRRQNTTTQYSDVPQTVALRRELGLFDCFSMVVGVIIGSGIFISPKGVLQNTNSVGWFLVVWLVGGVFSCLGALSYVELATSIPLAGGDYIFLVHSFGYLAGFLRIWTMIVAVRTGPLTLLSITSATYMVGKYASCSALAVRIVAACILAAVCFLNSWSVSVSKKVQNVCTVAKILGLAVIILTGLSHLARGETSSFHEPFQPIEGAESVLWGQFPAAFFSGVFAFSGWQALPQITEEIINPGKTMPLAICLAMGVVTSIYLLTNVAYLAVLSPAEILQSDAIAMTFGEHALGAYWWLMPLSVILSCIGSINGSVFGTARAFFAASREGQLPVILGMVHVHRQTPLPAAALSLPLCLGMLMIEDIYTIINYLSFSRWLFIGMTCTAVPYFRWKYPHIQRPFKVPLIVPLLFALCAFGSVILSTVSDPVAFLGGLGVTLLGLPVYFVGVRWKRKPRWFTNAMCCLTRFLQKLLLVVSTEMGSSPQGIEQAHSRRPREQRAHGDESQDSREPLLEHQADGDHYGSQEMLIPDRIDGSQGIQS